MQIGCLLGCLQQGDRIVQIAVKQRVVLDHFGDPGVAEQCRAQYAKHEAALRVLFGEAQRRGRLHQARCCVDGKRRPRGDLGYALRIPGELFGQPQTHEGEHLRVHKAGAEVE